MPHTMRILATAALMLFSCDGVENTATVDLDAMVGRCVYTNPFAQALECKGYLGSGWTRDAASDDCIEPMLGAAEGTFEPGLPCEEDALMGRCDIAEGHAEQTVLFYSSTDAMACLAVETGCDHADGVFTPDALCEG